MKRSILLEKYPINTLKIAKNETNLKNVDEILAHFKAKIQAHPIAVYIATFDHYAHTQSIDGEINPDILAAKNLLFCFSGKLPNSAILAVRPRSIGVVEEADCFKIEFMDVPNEQLHDTLVTWAQSILV